MRDRLEDSGGQFGAADDQVGQVRIGLIVAQRRAVKPRYVKAGGARDPAGAAESHWVLSAGVDEVQTFSTAQPPPLAPPPSGRPRIVISRTRPPEVAHKVAELLGGELFQMGSAGAKAMAVVRGEAHAYVHAGGQYEWDSAAPAGVAAATGLHVSRLDGSPLRYNQPNPYLPDLVICRPELAAAILKAIAQA